MDGDEQAGRSRQTPVNRSRSGAAVPSEPVHLAVIRRAADICGGAETLAHRVGAPPQLVSDCIEGRTGVPSDLFLAAVDILMARMIAELDSGSKTADTITQP